MFDKAVAKSKAWIKSNPTLSGAVAGGVAGSVVPGFGTIVGVLSGAVVGHLAGQDQSKPKEIK